jgi:aspartate/methionine/tyrosine aminotransferase
LAFIEERCVRRGLAIISDEVYYGLSYNDEKPFYSMGTL